MRADRVLLFATTIYGYPVAQGRPRTRVLQRSGGAAIPVVYDPGNAKAWKGAVKAQLVAALPPAWRMLEGPLAVTMIFRLPKAKSVRKAETYPAKKPDLDNLWKAVTDAAQGVLFADDKQIVAAEVSKQYGERPGVEIEVRECL